MVWQVSRPTFLPPTKDHTCLPSVLHEAVASLTFSGVPRTLPVLDSRSRHSSLPLAVDRHRSRTWSPSGAVRKILSPQTTGVEEPSPGMRTFQTTLVVSFHSVGRFF